MPLSTKDLHLCFSAASTLCWAQGMCLMHISIKCIHVQGINGERQTEWLASNAHMWVEAPRETRRIRFIVQWEGLCLEM